LFSILLFYSTVCFHFAEQINDDDDDDDISAYYRALIKHFIVLRYMFSVSYDIIFTVNIH